MLEFSFKLVKILTIRYEMVKTWISETKKVCLAFYFKEDYKYV